MKYKKKVWTYIEEEEAVVVPSALSALYLGVEKILKKIINYDTSCSKF